ncbi:MAG: hypothetical protein AAF533_25725 [Acidobacteriota bacterium]
MSSATQTNLCIYRVTADREDDFREVLTRHWPALREAGLATDRRPTIYLGREEGGPVFYEIFEWTSPEGPRLAHESPGVMAVWEPMGEMTEDRGGRPGMEFPVVAPLEIVYPGDE